ncbi:MAG TPA: hypothetical protein VMU05_15790 [Dongiaceae bacterium]|nr:hypothetical protein [Dongiaceae bacterium]
MRHFPRVLTLILAALTCAAAQNPQAAQTSQAPPQTARQALIEMFLSKAEDDFSKHLPDAARHALIHKGETPDSSFVLRIATAGPAMVAEGGHIETFDSGPNILVTEQPERHEKIEVAVEHDGLVGEQDEIELSVHLYKNGQEQTLPVIPRLIFTLNQEKEVWKLTEVTVAGHIPLTDPDYLKELRKEQDEANEAMVQMRMGMLATAQKAYAAAHPETGYACSLQSFATPSTLPPGAESAPPTDPGQGNEEWRGYRFALSGCQGTPSTKYRLTATPIDPQSQAKTFCADESGTLKFITDGKPSTCFSSGQDVTAPAAVSADE